MTFLSLIRVKKIAINCSLNVVKNKIRYCNFQITSADIHIKGIVMTLILIILADIQLLKSEHACLL